MCIASFPGRPRKQFDPVCCNRTTLINAIRDDVSDRHADAVTDGFYQSNADAIIFADRINFADCYSLGHTDAECNSHPNDHFKPNVDSFTDKNRKPVSDV